MTGSVPRLLDFAALDDLAFAAERGRLDVSNVPPFSLGDLGPTLEFYQLSGSKLLPSPGNAPWLSLGGLGPLVQSLEEGKRLWICPWTRRIGFLRTTLTPPEETTWTGFGIAAQQAATRVGFPQPVAAQLTAALGEFYSNVYEHSQASETGIIAFRAHPGRFELVVADSGIGVLESLRTSTEYVKLRDHGEALQLALADGVSRHGSRSGRGHGFRPLFVGLANLNGALRFRSGDHALLINGQDPSPMAARPAEKPAITGFFISVSCRIASR